MMATVPAARLTAEQRRAFDDDGFLVVENALSDDERRTYVEIVDALADRHRHEHGLDDDDATFVEVRNAIAGDHRLLPLLTMPTTFPLVAELMGPNLQVNTTHAMVTPPQPPGTPDTFKRISWHHDGAVAPSPSGQQLQPAPVGGVLPWLYTKIGYFLTDLTEAGKGSLRVVPGSHRSASAPSRTGDAVDPDGAIELLVPAGSAVLFQQRLWHAVGPNLSAETRKAIYIGYCYRWVKPLDYVTADPDLLAACSPVERQLLGDHSSALAFWLATPDELPLHDWLEAHLAR